MIFWKRLTPFKVISFDLDDTLYDNLPVILRAEEDFAVLLCDRYKLEGFARDPVFWNIVKRRLWEAEPALLDDVTLLRARTLVQAFELLKRPLPGGLKEAFALVDEFVSVRSSFRVPQCTIDLLSILSEAYPLAALSNGNVNLKAIGLERFFSYNLRPSHEGLRRKPNADLFVELSKLCKVSLGEILHVGDGPSTDINGAVAAGVQCAWLKGGYGARAYSFYKLASTPHVVLDSLTELLHITEGNLTILKAQRQEHHGR